MSVRIESALNKIGNEPKQAKALEVGKNHEADIPMVPESRPKRSLNVEGPPYPFWY